MMGPGHHSRNDPITADKVIAISRQLTIFQSNQIPQMILLGSDHDTGEPARYMDLCWIRNFIRTVLSVISPSLNSENYQETFTRTYSVLY